MASTGQELEKFTGSDKEFDGFLKLKNWKGQARKVSHTMIYTVDGKVIAVSEVDKEFGVTRYIKP